MTVPTLEEPACRPTEPHSTVDNEPQGEAPSGAIETDSSGRCGHQFTRRNWLVGAGTLAAAGSLTPWILQRVERFQRAATVIARATSYDAGLVDIIRRGLNELGMGRSEVRDRSILLKPNLVEPTREAPHVNTHPALVRAVVEVFRQWDARRVIVAEGQGHIRDAWLVLEQSGLEPVLHEGGIEFVDLNHDDVVAVPNRLGVTGLDTFYLPRTLLQADLVVSLPKMKTHHWAGVTLSMKNLFGVMPGICYGWPKNVLHHHGIARSILDINATVRPHLAIVDAIVGMEGDGPIMGTPKTANLLLMGRNLAAVDATGARLMGFDPLRLEFLRAASGRLGPVLEHHIEQRGEPIAACASRFELIDHPHFKQFRR